MTFIKSKLFLLAAALLWLKEIILDSYFQLPFTILLILRPGDESLKRYVWGLWIAQDQKVNAILGGNPDVTVSSKVGYLSTNGSNTARLMEIVIDWLFYKLAGQLNHCFASIEHDEDHYSYFWK